ncbi:hypothetical protein [Streptomyces sp. NPDC101165]|uniref:hypothetical protein n=1 Tax=Streptomyces sp. NPDC101165 TaxID=3366119 RepID=UPI003828FB53
MSAQRSSTVEVPEIRVPFPLNRHPDYAHVPQEFAAWFNDPNSMEKEAVVLDVHNLGILLAREAGVPLREGARLLAACLRARVRDFAGQRAAGPCTAAWTIDSAASHVGGIPSEGRTERAL